MGTHASRASACPEQGSQSTVILNSRISTQETIGQKGFFLNKKMLLPSRVKRYIKFGISRHFPCYSALCFWREQDRQTGEGWAEEEEVGVGEKNKSKSHLSSLH